MSMTRDELIEAMARAVHETMSGQAVIQYLDNPFDASAIATAALDAIEAQGMAIVPVEATRGMLEAGAIGSGEDSENVASGAWEAMIDAGKL